MSDYIRHDSDQPFQAGNQLSTKLDGHFWAVALVS